MGIPAAIDPVECALRAEIQKAWAFRFDGRPCPTDDLREVWAVLYPWNRVPGVAARGVADGPSELGHRQRAACCAVRARRGGGCRCWIYA